MENKTAHATQKWVCIGDPKLLEQAASMAPNLFYIRTQNDTEINIQLSFPGSMLGTETDAIMIGTQLHRE